MQYFLEGLGFGLFLTVSMGPIFVALTQTSLEKGFWPGTTVGIGVWSSDLIIIGSCLSLVNLVKHLINNTVFNLGMGIGGGIVMIIIGIGMFFHKASINYNDKQYSAKNYLGFWMKGFLVNTLNPFTYVFWLAVISTYVFGRGTNIQNTIIFLGTIMLVIISSDLLKVGLASYIRDRLQEKHIKWATNISGVFLIIFGLVLMIRVLMEL